MFPVGEYGFIEAQDGHEVYFQKTSVLNNAFNLLTVGTDVAFAEEPGEKGPQASTVKLTRRRRPRRPSSMASLQPSGR